MSAPRRQSQVSLRGASAKEISRDVLLQKVSHARDLRLYDRRASASALFIQRVWRRYHMTRKFAEQFYEEWEALVRDSSISKTRKWISESLLRPFLFFVTRSTSLNCKLQLTSWKCFGPCFEILLQSINSPDPEKNFCFFTAGTIEEKSSWLYQSRKLILVCSFILEDTRPEFKDRVTVCTFAMRLAIALTDSNGWKCFQNKKGIEAHTLAERVLIGFISTRKFGLYKCLRVYIMKQQAHFYTGGITAPDDKDNLLIAVSMLTLALRPFHLKKSDVAAAELSNFNEAEEQFVTLILTIPHLTQWLPQFLLPALKHQDVIFPCLKFLMNFKEEIFFMLSKLDKEIISSPSIHISSSGWALVNIINLVRESDNNGNLGSFIRDLDCDLYLKSATCLAESYFNFLERVKYKQKESDDFLEHDGCSPDVIESDVPNDVKLLYLNLLQPVHQQCHLVNLLAFLNNTMPFDQNADSMKKISEFRGTLEVITIVRFYYYILRIHSLLNPSMGRLPLLNVLSFDPGFIVELWKDLENSVFSELNLSESKSLSSVSESYPEANYDKRQKSNLKDTGNKISNMLQKFTGKSAEIGGTYSNDNPSSAQVNDDTYNLWDVKSMRQGLLGISKDVSITLHLFCSVYSHLLLVLDDVEFYEKQVPFSIQQQQRIAAMLNSFVYNTFIHNAPGNKPMMETVLRCLHLLYERDCRRKFCPPSLWVAPARKSRVPIVSLARAHEALHSNSVARDTSSALSMSDIITSMQHVYPFEERVEMFREFIKLDKASIKAAGEISGRGLGSLNVVIRRGHIIEDGFRQLNCPGSMLKSGLNVLFINESDLSEAGLDYGGLSKEFLTDLAKAAFDPQYGLFCSTSTSERFLIPNTSARFLEHSIEMIEFLGKIVGKALYDGILLDFSFSLVFVKKLLGRYSFLDELSTLDPELYRNLIYVKHFDGDISDLSLDFTITEELCGKMVINELKPGGKNLSVTNQNKLQYVHAIADYKLNRQILPLANAFYRGLVGIISPSWLRLFNANEFNQLLSGGEHDLDIDDLRRNTKYTGGYSEGSRTIRLFWEVLRGFMPSERCMLLKFVTSCSRAPLLGFKHLHPSFTIHKVVCDTTLWATIGGQDVVRLPSASTCYNTLKLPKYKRSSTLRTKLLYAINSNSGFELS